MLTKQRQHKALQVLREEVQWQCFFALTAYDELDEKVDALRDVDRRAKEVQPEDFYKIWYSLHTFLVAVGNISKLFWPPKPRKKNTRMHGLRDELKASYQVEDSCVLNSRELRDDLEHFDERLEEWAVKTQRGSIINRNIGPSELFVPADICDQLLYFDYETYTLTFQDKSCPLEPIRDAVLALLTHSPRTHAYKSTMYAWIPALLFEKTEDHGTSS